MTQSAASMPTARRRYRTSRHAKINSAPPSAASISTGSRKNIPMVVRKGALLSFAETSPALSRSSAPRSGSLIVSLTRIAATTPTMPMATKASRQSKTAATVAPKAMPIAAPIGGPRL